MKRNLLFNLLLILLFPVVNVQAQTWEWAKHSIVSGWGVMYGSEPYNVGAHVATDQSGNVYEAVSGNMLSVAFGPYMWGGGSAEDDLCFLKYDSTGHILWFKGVTLSDGDVHSAVTDRLGNVFFCGHYGGVSATFGTTVLGNPYLATVGHSGNLNYIVKYDGAGNLKWANMTGNCQVFTPASIATDDSGNVFFTSTFDIDTLVAGTELLVNNSTYPGGVNIFTVKYDSLGNIVWAKSEGDKYFTTATAAACDHYGNVYITGSFEQDSFTVGGYRLHPDSGYSFIIKYNGNGDVIWAKTKGGDYISNIALDNNRGVYIAGNYYQDTAFFPPYTLFNHKTTVGNFSNLFLVKLDTAGNNIWAKSAGGTNDRVTYPECLSVDTSGNIWMTGAFDSVSVFGTDTLTYPAGAVNPNFLAAYSPTGSLLYLTALQGGAPGGFSSVFNTSGLSTDRFNNMYVANSYNCSPFVLDTTTLTTPQQDYFIAKFHPPVFSTLKAIQESNDREIVLFPNPAADEFNVGVGGSFGNAQLVLYNMAGQQVMSTAVRSGNTAVSTAALPDGVYLCKILVDGQSTTKKVMVVH